MRKSILLITSVFFSFCGYSQENLFENISQFAIGSEMIDGAGAVAYDNEGNMLLLGAFRAAVDFDPGASSNVIEPLGSPDIFLAKYTSEGTLVWVFNLGRISLSNGMDGNGLAVDANNNIYITGSFSNTVDFDPSGDVHPATSSGGKDAFLAKYASDGSFQWVKTFGSSAYDYGDVVTIGADGSIYLGLKYAGTVDLDPGEGEVSVSPQAGAADATLLKLNSNGEYQWHYTLSTANNDAVTAIALSDGGQIAVGATINGATSGFGERDMFLAVLNADGAESWSYNFNNYEKANRISTIIFTEDDAEMYIGGRIEGETDFAPSPDNTVQVDPLFADVFMAKYTVADGSLIWARNVVSAGTGDFLVGMTESGTALMVTGSFDVSITFNPNNPGSTVPSAGGSDIFLAAFDNADGSFLSAATYGGEGNELAVAAHFLPEGKLVLAGDFFGSVQLGSSQDPVSSNGYSDIFFGEFSYMTNVSDKLTLAASGDKLNIYPVPATTNLFLELPQSTVHTAATLKVFNVVGELTRLQRVDFAGNTYRMSIEDLKPGVYILEVQIEGVPTTKRFVKK